MSMMEDAGKLVTTEPEVTAADCWRGKVYLLSNLLLLLLDSTVLLSLCKASILTGLTLFLQLHGNSHSSPLLF